MIANVDDRFAMIRSIDEKAFAARVAMEPVQALH